MNTYIGIDNGVSGQIGIVNDCGTASLYPMPIFNCLNYTKEKKFFNRVDTENLTGIFTTIVYPDIRFCFLERPMVNPGRFQATASALRAYEATLIVIERLKIPHDTIDSKEWQKEMLPHGLWRQVKTKKGRTVMKANPKELKQASKDVAKRLFPSLNLESFKDCDGLLMAEYCRRMKR